MSSAASIKQVKKQLRKQIKEKLKSISQESLTHQSHLIHQNLLTHPKFKDARSIAVYMNMPDLEVQTMEIIKSCFTLGKNVYLPRCNYTQIPGRKLNYMSMIRMPTFQSVLNLTPQGKYQLLEPTQGEDVMETGNLDLIIVPGVAFDRAKNRMGHGAGFYDEFITTYT
ncbi:5-formyltetrahydrofolate cyclo-ligase [Candida viswanathii]|uniref:5-formyltetrahydrofolate cyclo-ligase n=1 Tax=Candida viswanathii TaxID=5486 RepID=A0A367XTN5_9ASCO|nr:5-formyltetrahydrofolate cyclo-ligase [Candida viswanathii]